MTEKDEVNIGELRQIMSWLATAGIEFIEICRPAATVRLTMEREPRMKGWARTVHALDDAEGTRERSAAVSEQSVGVAAHCAGIFLTTHPARSTPLVSAGAHVNAGDIVGLLRIAQLCVPVLAPVEGVVIDVLVAPGATVGYGTRVIELAPSA